uniref:RING-type domain-containing protein n=1 Tax=Callorhinchus milii TaxID=7868 RepID=A0A4W3JJ74_CALMI
MASGLPAGSFSEELRCPVCVDLFTAPVTLACGHSLCQACMDRGWEAGKHLCPKCQEPIAHHDLKVNEVLARLAERARAQGQYLKSSEDHHKPICLACGGEWRDSHREVADTQGKVREALTLTGDGTAILPADPASSAEDILHSNWPPARVR